VPEDVANAEVRDSAVSVRPRTGAVPAHRPAPDPDMLQRAVVLVRGARRPVLLVGGGAVASGAFAEVRALAECLDAPVATSITGKGIVAETEARACGVAGSMGNPIANQVLKSADLVVFIGTKAGQVATFGYEAFGSGVPTIHLDIDPEELGRNFPDSLPLVADVRSGLAALLAALADHHAKTDWDHPDIARRRSAWQQAEATALRRPGEPLHPAAVVEAVNVAATEDDVVVSDASLASGWMAVFYRARRAARQYLSPRGLAGLGWGAPAAVGAALASGGKRRVLLFAGDGGFAYSVQELEVMARLRLPVVAVILNNDTLAWVKHVEKKRIAEGFISTDFNHVDFAMVARGFGARGYQARTAEELAAALERERVPDGPALIDVATDQWATPVLRFSSTGE
jgi:acetolactate synthase-1/2/3 large subunit